jgi:folate-binding Fe-S cluster repair protein YgfZ
VALSLALEASRAECAALRIAHTHTHNALTETQAAYDSLLIQLKEEGSMLSQRDRDRYKAALKDLRDYEIYKEVVEAAMEKLQRELENVVKENRDLRTSREQEERIGLKHKRFVFLCFLPSSKLTAK